MRRIWPASFTRQATPDSAAKRAPSWLAKLIATAGCATMARAIDAEAAASNHSAPSKSCWPSTTGRLQMRPSGSTVARVPKCRSRIIAQTRAQTASSIRLIMAALLAEARQQRRQVLGVLLLDREDALEDAPAGRVARPDVRDHLAVALDGDALGDEVLAHH